MFQPQEGGMTLLPCRNIAFLMAKFWKNVRHIKRVFLPVTNLVTYNVGYPDEQLLVVV